MWLHLMITESTPKINLISINFDKKQGKTAKNSRH